MSGGLLPLSFVQRGYEATRGTLVAATSVQPILGGWLREMVERDFPAETRNSFVANYRNFPLRNYVEMGGITIAPTYEELAGWGSLFWKGLQAGSPTKPTGALSAVTAYTYAHTPTVASDDLGTATLELGDDTQTFGVPFCIGNHVELNWSRTGPMTMSMDLIGQRAIAQAKTGALTANTVEDIIGAQTTVTIDTTTIASTAVTTVVEMDAVWDNGWSQEFVLDGNLYPRGAHRGTARACALTATLLFSSATEYTSIFQSTGVGTPRKIRILNTGSNIAGSTGPLARTFTVDWYGVWQTAEFDTINGQRAVKFSGMSQYDSSAGWDWSVSTRNSLATIP